MPPSRTAICSGTSPCSDLDALLEAFEQPHARIVARQHAGRAGQLDEHRHERRQQPIHPLRQRLHDQQSA